MYKRFLHTIFVFLLLNITIPSLISQKNAKPDYFAAERKLLSRVNFGLSIKDALTGEVIYGYNANKNFIPASVLKLFYTLAAIETKGEDYRFKTGFYYTGEILPEGTLSGDLVIVAGGDPTLASKRFYQEGMQSFFELVIRKINEKGINCIEGNIIMVLPPYHYPVHGSWEYRDLGNYYGGGTYPFDFLDNEYSLKFQLGKKEGEPTRISGISPPELDFLTINNYVLTGKTGTGDNAYLYSVPYSVEVDARGTLYSPDGYYTIRGALPFPPASFLKFFGDYLDENNIYFESWDITEKPVKGLQPLFALSSPPLIDICEACNNYSINMYSEALASMLCLKGNHPESYLTEEEIHDFFKKYGMDFDKIRIVDGCGLSTSNILTPTQINDFLILMIKKLGLKKVMRVLPRGGVEGYAKYLFDKNENVYLKSGSVSGVLNYSGIVATDDGRHLVFSVMTNNVIEKDKSKVKKILIGIIRKIKRL